jgi:hypothetical protein
MGGAVAQIFALKTVTTQKWEKCRRRPYWHPNMGASAGETRYGSRNIADGESSSR